MKQKNNNLVAAASVLIVAFLMGLRAICVQTLAGLQHELVPAANTYDAAVETHEGSVRRTNDAAIAARHLLWKKGAADGTVAINTDGDIPLGTIDNIETGTGVGQSVLLLGKGSTKKMVASEAITVGEQVYTADGGKVQDLPEVEGTYYCVGTALTAAADDDDILEVADCVPFAVVIPA